MNELEQAYAAGVKHAFDLSGWLKSKPAQYDDKPSLWDTVQEKTAPYVSTKGVRIGDTGLSLKPKWGSSWGASLSGKF
jgi:hypothetical protein